MDIAHSDFIWGATASKALAGNHYSRDGKTSLDIFEIRDGEPKVTRTLDKPQVEQWLKSESSWPGTKLRMVFIDEDVRDTDNLCIDEGVMRQIFLTFEVSRQFASCLTKHHHPARVNHYDNQGKQTSHEFWYSAVKHSKSNPHSPRISKRILDWSRLTVWMRHKSEDGSMTIIAVRCPRDVKKEILDGSIEFQRSIPDYPMLIHLYFLRNVWFNYYDTVEETRAPMFVEEQKTSDISTTEHADRSKQLLSICRQLSALLTDSKFFKDCLSVLIEENDWLSHHVPNEVDNPTWQRRHQAFDEAFKSLLGDIRVSMKYARMYEQRVKIAIDESSALINQKGAEINLTVAQESAEIARVTRKDAKSLWKLQMLGIVYLPVSLASGILGMELFSYDSKTEVFKISGHVWIFFMLAVIFFSGTLGIMFGDGARDKWQQWRHSTGKENKERRRSVAERYSHWGGTSPYISGPEPALPK